MAEHEADAAHAAGHHVHGTMDIAEQRRTFEGFLRAASLVVVVAVAILLLLTFRI